jgi:hypothetical protein
MRTTTTTTTTAARITFLSYVTVVVLIGNDSYKLKACSTIRIGSAKKKQLTASDQQLCFHISALAIEEDIHAYTSTSLGS